MNQENLIVKRALREMKQLILENKQLKKEIQKVKSSTFNDYSILDKKSFKIDNILKEADESMDRYSEKLKKENKKYAKQKQSKGK